MSQHLRLLLPEPRLTTLEKLRHSLFAETGIWMPYDEIVSCALLLLAAEPDPPQAMQSLASAYRV